jgi:hypothetical protein
MPWPFGRYFTVVIDCCQLIDVTGGHQLIRLPGEAALVWPMK